jgi:hypothetical protein
MKKSITASSGCSRRATTSASAMEGDQHLVAVVAQQVAVLGAHRRRVVDEQDGAAELLAVAEHLPPRQSPRLPISL